MINPIHVLLKDDPCLEGDVADDKADPSAGHQLGQVYVLQYFWRTAGSMDHQHVFRRAGLSCQSGCTALANRAEWWVAIDLDLIVTIWYSKKYFFPKVFDGPTDRQLDY